MKFFSFHRWKTHLEQLNNDIITNVSNTSENSTRAIEFVNEFHNVTSQYCQALNSVIPIFTYMVRSIRMEYFGIVIKHIMSW